MSNKSHENAPWVQAQKSTFENWANQSLKDKGESISDAKVDFKDGLKLYSLYQQLTGKTIKHIDKKPKMKISFLQNLNVVINSFKKDKVKIVNVQGEDIYEENLKLILGLLWMLIQRYHILGSEEDSKQTAAKKLLLDFVNKLVKEPKATNFKKDWQDGVILSELINEIQPGCCPRDSRPPDNVDRVKNALDVAEQKLDVPKVIEPEYIVDAVDELSLMTYVTYLKKKYEENERTPHAPLCVASGPGLEDSPNSASPHHFKVELFNCYGALCPIRLEKDDEKGVQLNITGPQDSNFHTAFEEDGVCLVDYEATIPGQYSIDVTVGPQKESVKNSPFNLKITSAGHKISGKGVQDGPFEKDEKLPIEIDSGTPTADLFQQEKLQVRVQDPKGRELPVEVADSKDGKYAATYAPARSGSHKVDVALFGEAVFSKSVALESGRAKDTQLALSGELAERKRFPENRATGFVAKLSDKANAPVADAEVEVEIEDAAGAPAGKVHVANKADGRYEVTVDDVEQLGSYRVAVAVDGEPKASFAAECERGVQPELVTGSFTFEVLARDKSGQPKTTGGDRWEVEVKGPDDAVVQVETSDLGDGRYTATYHLAAQEGGPSTFKVSARLDGKHVASSPFKHELAPKPSVGQRLRNFFSRGK